jgi:DNA end-binding protein Ku
MLGPEGTPLSRRYYSQKSGRDLDDDEMIRGYEIEKGKYVVVSDEELERLAPEKTRDIALRQFVDKDSIPPFYFEHGYFLAPARGSEKAYQLLAETMEDGNRAGIATFVMRGKEHLVAIVADKGILRAETLRFADELRTPADVGLDRKKKKKIPRASVRRFETLISKRTKSRLSQKAMADEREKGLLRLVKRKHSRGKDVVETDEAESQQSNVIDIMEVLKKSLAAKR